METFLSGIAATGTAAHVRALGCLPSKNMGALRPTTNKNNVTIMTRSAIVSPVYFRLFFRLFLCQKIKAYLYQAFLCR